MNNNQYGVHFLCVFLVQLSLVQSILAAECDGKLFKDGELTQEVKKLMMAAGLKNPGQDASSAIIQTQQHWLRPKGTEREDIVDDEVLDKKCDVLLPLFSLLGLIDQRLPSQKKYTHMLIMSSHVPSQMISRFMFAQRLLNSGLSVDRISVLTGSHVIQRSKESAGRLVRKTEVQMVGELMEDLGLVQKWSLPDHLITYLHSLVNITAKLSFMSSKVTLFTAAPKKTRDGLVRPTTDDTLRVWKMFKPKKGSCLVVSNQPYVGYQVAAACKIMKDPAYSFEGVGPATKGVPLRVYLDTVARQLFNEFHPDYDVTMRSIEKIRARL